MSDKIDPGAGYRLLNPYEDVLPGDEFAVGGDWKVSAVMAGNPFKALGGAGCYRRKIEQPLPDPGFGWRLLATGEVLREGDECIDADEPYGPRQTQHPGSTVGSGPPLGQYYRRKLSAVGDGWRKLVVGEVLQAGDELYTIEGWVPVSLWLGYPLHPKAQASYRRRVPDWW